jgi:hypothetical protein
MYIRVLIERLGLTTQSRHLQTNKQKKSIKDLPNDLMERIVETRGSNFDWDTDCPELYLLPKFLHVNSGTVPPNILRSPFHSFNHLYGQICCQTD